MQAIILAAGMGKRLKELTKNNTKCMVKVNGCTLIERMLRQLEQVSLTRIVIVVGYEGEQLKEYISGLRGIDTPIIFIDNEIYDKTNNIYSLSLAQKYLMEEDTLLLESDLIFEDSVLDEILEDKRESLALVDKYESWMDGTCIKLDNDDVITAFVPGNQFKYEDAELYYKTVNIYKFSKEFSKNRYVPFLNAYTKALGDNEYYEQVLRVITNLDNPGIYAKRLNGQKWYEIDDAQDLDIASTIFQVSASEQFIRIQNRYGGYWRYPDIKDFSYPGNPYFPTQKLKDEIKASVDKLLINYPSGMDVVRLLAAKVLDVYESQVLVTNGIEECIHVLCQSIHRAGVILPSRQYLLMELKDKAVPFAVTTEDFSYTAKEIIDFYKDKNIECLFIYNPNYHTGFYLDNKELIEIIEWSNKQGIYVICDESTIDFVGLKKSVIDKNVILKYSNLIVLHNMSVAYGVTGIRLGCMITSDSKMINKMNALIPCWNIDSITEFFLQVIEKYLKDYREAICKCIDARQELIKLLSNINGIKVIPSSSNYVVVELLSNISAKMVAERLLSEYAILVRDVTDIMSIAGKQYIKIAVQTHENNRLLVDALYHVLDKNNTRVYGEHITLKDMRIFFEKRAEKQLPHRYNYVLYQDANPELALQRDEYEKKKILPYLHINAGSCILDIGCGVGRWGDELVGYLNTGKYVGVDYSLSLLEIAKRNFKKYEDKCVFLQGSFQEIEHIILDNHMFGKFDDILINGVLMYINDEEIAGCLDAVKNLTAHNGIIYIKESIGVNNRFTLNNYYSAEMETEYSAVYRDLKDYQERIQKHFLSAGFSIVNEGATWDDTQWNRKETTSYYWILQKM